MMLGIVVGAGGYTIACPVLDKRFLLSTDSGQKTKHNFNILFYVQ